MLSIYIQYNDNIYREQHQTLLNLLVTHFLSTAYVHLQIMDLI